RQELSQHQESVGGRLGRAQFNPATDVGHDELSDGLGASPEVQKIRRKQAAVRVGQPQSRTSITCRDEKTFRRLLDADHRQSSRSRAPLRSDPSIKQGLEEVRYSDCYLVRKKNPAWRRGRPGLFSF